MSAEAKAMGALNALKPEWLAQADADLTVMHEILEEMTKLEAALAPLSKQLYGIAHNLKGQAGTFGFSLLSEIAARICQLVNRHSDEVEIVPALKAHYAGVKFVLSRRLEGDGGKAGLAILRKLDSFARQGAGK